MRDQTDPEVTEAIRRTMQGNRGRDTGPELAVRSILHARGLRFRVNQPLPFDHRRRADLTFTRARLFVFVDGCFWHGCPDHFIEPKTRRDFWVAKIEGNRSRDIDTRRCLEALGATVLRVWEHEDPLAAADIVETTYRSILAPLAVCATPLKIPPVSAKLDPSVSSDEAADRGYETGFDGLGS